MNKARKSIQDLDKNVIKVNEMVRTWRRNFKTIEGGKVRKLRLNKN